MGLLDELPFPSSVSPRQSSSPTSEISRGPATLSTSSTSSTARASPSEAEKLAHLRGQAAHPVTTPTSDRTRRQAGLFFGGVAFVVFSTIITRRSLTRRYKPSSLPAKPISATPGAKKAGFANSTSAEGYVSAAEAAATAKGGPGAAGKDAAQAELNNSGPILAVEAMTVATMNVFSWAIMVTGGALWYFDVASMDDLRRKVRGGLGVDGSGRTEQEVEEEMEEWLATVLERRDQKKAAIVSPTVLDEPRRSG